MARPTIDKSKLQPPKGTRDFYGAEMAVRRHIEGVWRSVSVNHGFEEIEGPTFEHLDLYKIKSGEGIVSELFSFRRAGGDTDYALRPEFTPTLARMYAARAAQLPKPTKWFCIPSHFRAERPQRGRLREFVQWNVDVIGDETPAAEAEIIATTVGVLEGLGLASKDVTVKISHREMVTDALTAIGVAADQHEAAMQLLDRREKLPADEFARRAEAIKFDEARFTGATESAQSAINDAILALENGRQPDTRALSPAVEQVIGLIRSLAAIDMLKWCEFDLSVVRGLAYYTGTVFEVVVEGERAVAGGGRYDKLIEMFGGPPTPACGIAMGDVVIRLVLEDLGLLRSAESYLPRPDAFIISNGNEAAEAALPPLVVRLRRAGLHVRRSHRSTRNVGKLLGEAGKSRARFAIILDDETSAGRVSIKNLETGEQRDGVPIGDLPAVLTAEDSI